MGYLWRTLACDLIYAILICDLALACLAALGFRSLIFASSLRTFLSEDALEMGNPSLLFCYVNIITFVVFGCLSYIKNHDGTANLSKLKEAVLWELWIVITNFASMLVFVHSVTYILNIQLIYKDYVCIVTANSTTAHVSPALMESFPEFEDICSVPTPSFRYAAMTFSIVLLFLHMIHSKLPLFKLFEALVLIDIIAVIWGLLFFELRMDTLPEADMYLGAVVGLIYAATAIRSIFGALFNCLPPTSLRGTKALAFKMARSKKLSKEYRRLLKTSRTGVNSTNV